MNNETTRPAISEELRPVLEQLVSEGYEVWTYTPSYGEINSLFWYENGRVLNIQPNSWRNDRYARDRFDLGVSYKPSHENGSGCGLTQDIHDTGTPAAELLQHRTRPTWVRGIENYSSIEAKIKDTRPLDFWRIG